MFCVYVREILGELIWNYSKKLPDLKSGKKTEPKPKLFGPDIFGWGGGLPREGVGARKFSISFETERNQTFWRDIPGLLAGYPGAPEKFEKKEFVFNFRSL